jgi:hypothetical protein
MPVTPAAPEDLGLLTLTDLAEHTGVPRPTLISWMRADQMHALKLDGVYRSTITEVRRAAESVQKRKPRRWRLDAADIDEELEAGEAATA